MTDEEALKVRKVELSENLNFFLMNYRWLIANSYRKQVLDAEIKLIQLELERLKEATWQKESPSFSYQWTYLH